ncbi:nucleotide-binding universal stress UspA family protein [Nonomuraea muscovyensis]|uniref:Nucleotide-binding universal stress UspA family protein n=1 Tax=Nonomuraea muscovyensis TaxID=1124761 RepID=A0A7X0F175_9ACTN|nr:universal stress protein [Nonomuraea muscovyensis]MBB6352112.1 nucleotide-binding universal stress UspA family protein [Nonomuraea muscovyensis]
MFVVLDGSLASLAALRRAVDEARLREAHLLAVRVLSGSGSLRDLDGDDEALRRARDAVWTASEEALGRLPGARRAAAGPPARPVAHPAAPPRRGPPPAGLTAPRPLPRMSA